MSISTHALREEGDSESPSSWLTKQHFYPRPPRGGRQRRTRRPHNGRPISTHALREEGDGLDSAGYPGIGGISTHALREEGDGYLVLLLVFGFLFLPTPSARRATCLAL